MLQKLINTIDCQNSQFINQYQINQIKKVQNSTLQFLTKKKKLEIDKFSISKQIKFTNRSQNYNRKIGKMIKAQANDINVVVRDAHTNQPILQFEIPFNTKMKNIHKILFQNKNEFQSRKQKLIGFETIFQDSLQDYCLHQQIGTIRCDLSLKPLFSQPTITGLAKYKLLKCLATGGFSKVYLVRSLHSGQFFAAKFIDKLKVSTDDKKTLIMNEKMVNELSDYQFLVKMEEFIETQNFYVFVMDYCPGGELFYLLRRVKRMNEQEARVYFVEILLGLQYLHSKGIMYRDLKPQNIMLDEKGHAKIADFGLAKFSKQKSYSFCGSIEYMSPQIVTNAGHSFEVDFYCLGALLYELLIGCPPFYDPQVGEYETKKNIAFKEVEFPQEIYLSNQVKDIIEKLLVKNPNQRLGHFAGAKEIMLHPWIGKINRAFIELKNFDAPFSPNLTKFNFDPDEVGLSEQRFTNKISNEYDLIKQKRGIRFSKAQKEIIEKKLNSKSKSPYAKKYSLNMKRSSKPTKNQSLKNLLNASTGYQSQSNFKNLIYSQTIGAKNKKTLSKNKSPSFVSMPKKQYSLSKKTLKTSQPYGVSKLYVMKTESGQSHEVQNPYKFSKKQKMLTQANVLFREVSNDFSSSTKNFMKKQANDHLTSALQKHLNEKNGLKKCSKLKVVKKTFNETSSKGFQYGKQFRDTCIV